MLSKKNETSLHLKCYKKGFLIYAVHKIATNVPRAGDRNPVLRLRQGYGACTLLPAGIIV
jgi:hypothetical protein